MMRNPMNTLFIVLVFGLIGCGKNPEIVDPPIVEPPKPPNPGKAEVSLLLFAAPWCGPCRVELPEVQRLHNERLAKYGKKLDVAVYVTSGTASHKAPTEEIAVRYGEALKLSFRMIPDLDGSPSKFAKWPNYRKYIGAGSDLPAAAVLNGEGVILKTFKGGGPDAAVVITEYVESQLTK